MYAKIDFERLRNFRLNQRSLRVKFAHFRDAVNKVRNVDDIGLLIIFPSTFTAKAQNTCMNELKMQRRTSVPMVKWIPSSRLHKIQSGERYSKKCLI